MKGPSLQRTAVISAALHLTILLLTLLTIRQTNHIIMPSPYIVSIVEPSNKSFRADIKSQKLYTKTTKTVLPKKLYETRKRQKEKIESKRVEERISEIEAKKRIERIVRLRSIISETGAEHHIRKPLPQSTKNGPSEGIPFDTDNYYLKIHDEIWHEWSWGDFKKKDLLTIISVKIQKDGTIILQGIEKSSGNKLFDRSALKAITMASPVTPPPYEIVIGIRFYP